MTVSLGSIFHLARLIGGERILDAFPIVAPALSSAAPRVHRQPEQLPPRLPRPQHPPPLPAQTRGQDPAQVRILIPGRDLRAQDHFRIRAQALVKGRTKDRKRFRITIPVLKMAPVVIQGQVLPQAQAQAQAQEMDPEKTEMQL